MSITQQQTNARTGFKQEMQTRHIVMLALGGVIGTGLFLTSGYTVNQAGPAGCGDRLHHRCADGVHGDDVPR